MPLAGIRVLDLTRVAAGPLTTRLMANFGAEVIKVESSGDRMDPVRVQPVKGEFHVDLPDLFNDVNTGKKSVAIDLASERGKNLLRELVAHCDVMVNNFSGGSLARMGFPHQPPRGMGVAYPDFTSPHIGVTAILAALRARESSGEGREIELSQLSATVSLLGAQWMQFDRVGADLPRVGNPGFNSLAGRRSENEQIESAVCAWTSSLSKWEAAERLQAAGIAANAVEDLRDMMDLDEHFRDHYQRVEQPTHPGFGIWIDRAPWEFAHLKPRTLERAPMLGEHTQQVLSELLGMQESEIAELVGEGVVG